MEEDKNSRRRQLEEDQIGVCKTIAGRSVGTSLRTTLSILSNNYFECHTRVCSLLVCFFEIVLLIAELLVKMASARNEAPKFSKLDKLNTSNFVQWREDIVSELMLHNLDHYLSHVPIPDSDARRQIYASEVKFVTSLIRKSVELEFIDIVDRNRTDAMDYSDKPPSLPPKTRKSTRVTKSPNYFQSNNVLSSALHYIEPNSYQEAEKTNDWLEWQKVINEELNSIKDNKVWSLVDKTECMQKKPLTTRWVFKRKTVRDKNIIFRARLVVKGFEQKYGTDFSETYAPVTTNDTIRTVLAHAAFKGNHIHQLDVQTAFLNANLSEEIFSQPGTGYFVLSVCCCVLFLASLCFQEHSYSYGRDNCLNGVPYRRHTYV